jgi:hypothetical protein
MLLGGHGFPVARPRKALAQVQRYLVAVMRTAAALTTDYILELPEVSIEAPIVEFYQDVDLRQLGQQIRA